MSMGQVAHAEEKKFFQANPSYMHMANRMGTSYLSKVLIMTLT